MKNQKIMTFGNMNGRNMSSCMFTEMDELQYFQKTLELFNAAIQTNLPADHEANGKALIPVDLNFKFYNKFFK